MKHFIAPLYIETNPLSKEKLACGLLAVMPDQYIFQWADQKLELAEKLAGPDYKGYFKDLFKMLDEGISAEHEKRLATGGLFEDSSALSPSYFAYLKQYDAGPVQFGEVKPYAGPLDEAAFEQLFNELVFDAPAKKEARTTLVKRLSVRLKRPALTAHADVNYTLPETAIPRYLEKASVMVSSVNGTVFVAQPFDLANKVDYLARRARELDTLQHAMQHVADKLKRPLEPMQLVIGEQQPEGEHAELIRKIHQHMHDVFSVVTVPQFEERLDKVEADPKAQKLSVLLQGD